MSTLRELLNLTRKLAVLDLETTGKSTRQDRIVQIAITMHYPDRDAVRWKSLVNPGRSIPQAATDVHHITDEMVKDAPLFKTMAEPLARHLTDVDLCGYNLASYDLPLLREEMRRASVAWDWDANGSFVIDAHRIYQILYPRNLEAAYEEFTGKKVSGAHDAGNDVEATEETLIGQLTRFPQVPRTAAELYDFCFPKDPDALDRAGKIVWREGVACLAFGKRWNGSPLESVDKKYLHWMVSDDFPVDTKNVIRAFLAGKTLTRDT